MWELPGLEVAVDGSIARVTLSRPEKLNALDRATLEGLATVAARLDADDAVKIAHHHRIRVSAES